MCTTQQQAAALQLRPAACVPPGRALQLVCPKPLIAWGWYARVAAYTHADIPYQPSPGYAGPDQPKRLKASQARQLTFQTPQSGAPLPRSVAEGKEEVGTAGQLRAPG